MENIGLQLYSVKELTQQDFLGTLKKLGKIGYDGVEFAGYFNTPAGELRKALNEYGLKVAGSHIGIGALMEQPDKVLEYENEIGNPYVICPGLPGNMCDSADAWKRTAETFNRIGEKCRESGVVFGYHNHAFEFRKFDGHYGFDILMENTEADLVQIQLDTFWVEYSALRSVDIMNTYSNRCPLLHIKDMKSLEEKVNTEIGKGIMDFKGITSLGKKLGVKWYTVEQEEFEIPQLQSVEESLKYLRSIL